MDANSPAGLGAVDSIAYVAGDAARNTYAYGTVNGRVQMTRDGGATWIDLDSRRTIPRPVNALAFDPTNPSV